MYINSLTKPCTGCMSAIVAFGIKKVVYSTDTDGEYEILERNQQCICD